MNFLAAASFALAKQDPEEFLIVDSDIYRRVDGRWVETESAPSVVGLDGDGLSLLSVARDVEILGEPAEENRELIARQARRHGRHRCIARPPIETVRTQSTDQSLGKIL